MSPLWHRPLSPPWHRTSLPSPPCLLSGTVPFSVLCLAPPRLPSPLLPSPFSPHPHLSSSPPSPATPHSPASALFQRPLGPRLLSTSRHRPSSAPDALPPFPRYRSAKQDRTEGLCSALFGRTEALHSIKPIKPNKIAFVQPNRTKQRPSARPCLAEQRANAGRGGAGPVPESGEEMGAEGGHRERAGAREWGVLEKGKETGTAPERGVLGKVKETGQRQRGGCWGKVKEKGQRRRGGGRGGDEARGCGEKRGRVV